MKTKTIWLAALALLAVFFISGTVFAEGEVPAEEPPAVPETPAAAVEAPPPPEVQETPVEPAAVVEEAPPPAESEAQAPAEELPAAEETPAAEEAPMAETEPVVEEVPAVEEPVITELAPEPGEAALAAEEALPAVEELPIVAEAPVLVDAEGEPLVLATEETAELMENADPYFIVGATKYCFVPLAGTCDASCNGGCVKNASPIQAAINYINTNDMDPNYGFIYVEKATYTGNVTVDYTLQPNLTSLTGLIGLESGGLYPTISGTLTLRNLTNGFTLEGFNITGGTLIQNSVGQFEIDTVTTTLTMDNVDASGSSGDGIRISRHKGNVLIKNSTANQTGGTGILINDQISGSVTLNSVMANGNTTSLGFVIDADHSPVSINGAVANNNQEGGFLIYARGATLKNVAALENNWEGIKITLFGGSALLENAVANNNGRGIEIVYDSYPEALTMPVTPVTLRNVTANFNNEEGIHISVLGAVTLYNTGALNNDNNVYGIDYDGIYIDTLGTVNITNAAAGNNKGNGLYVRTKGAITISGIYASNNGLSGADLDNCLYSESTSLCAGSGAIIVRSTSGTLNDLSDNGHFGLWAVSKGAITVTNLRANNNGADGAYLTNRFGGSIAGITVNTLGAVRNDFSHNGWNTEYDPRNDENPDNDYYQSLRNGLSALSAGNISVTNMDAWQNKYGGGGIYLDTKFATAARTVTLSNSNTGENDWVGVWIWSRGNITLTNVSANDNHSEGGIHVDNCRDYDPITEIEDGICSLSGNILLTNIDTHNNNGTGLTALSKGTITLNGVNSSNNGNTGIHAQNDFSGATAGVTLTNINANDNNNTGLEVFTNGSAILANINTHNNAKTNGVIEMGYTVQDFFNQNHGPDQWWFEGVPGTLYNFLVQADAGWALNRTEFDPWIELYNADYPETPLAISVYCVENNYCAFSFNPSDTPFNYTETTKFFVRVGSTASDGFYRLSLNDDPTPDESTQMVWVGGTAITAGGGITVRGINSSSNSLTGLSATTMNNGAITLSNLQIFGNGAEGVYLICGQNPADINDSGWGIGTITISGSNAINDNGWDGLIMGTSGNVIISSLEASWNGRPTGSSGISIRERFGGDYNARAVTLTGINAGENGGWGLFINATGNVTLTNANFWGNLNEAGIDIANDFGYGTIRLTNVTSNNNQGIGIDLYSRGLITLSGVEANGNWGYGIHLKNDFSGATAGITLSTVRAENNGDTGITALTNGALLMANINANSNYLMWGGIDTGTTVQNYYSFNREPDHWWFEAVEGVPITLTLWADGQNDSGWLNRWDYDPFLQVFDGEGIEVTFDPADITFEYSNTPDPYDQNWTSNDFYQITWTPGTGEGGWYQLEVSSANDSSGFYRLSVGDDDLSDIAVHFVDGLAYQAGGSVVLSGTNNFRDNEQAGLIGWNNGNVTLTNTVAWGNGTEGIYADNTGGSGNVTLLGTNASSSNGWEGLRIITGGAVNLSNLEASLNGQDGVKIEANTALKTVTLNNITALWNGINGLNLFTNGLTTLNYVRAWFNGDSGANVNTNGYLLKSLNSSYICNDAYGLIYNDYGLTDINSIYLGNGIADKWPIP